tara:strand:+ start:237 stop:530 length:294 start_codon:yes stop_codon:yes gene_type:complete
MSKSQKIQIPMPLSTPRVVHLSRTSGFALPGANPGGKIPQVIVKVQAKNSSLKRKLPSTKSKTGGKYHRKSKKTRKQTKKKGKKHRRSSKKSRKTRK